MKVIQLNYSDLNGGAARAAYRIHHALRQAGVDSGLFVDSATSGDWTVQGPKTRIGQGLAKLRPTLGRAVFNPVFKTHNPMTHSPSLLPSGRVNALNNSDADLLHLHWVQGEMLSIAEIGRLRKPVVWTLHDMWAFCGAEHYTEEYRWRGGYRKADRPHYESGFDLNRWTWERKRKQWQRPMHIVTPSKWLAQCVRESALMRDWPVSVIPNPIDTKRWRPLEQNLARELLGLPKGVPLLLFGAIGGSRDPRKGFDLLQMALQHLRGEIPELELVVFGQLQPKDPPDLGFPIYYTGHLHDDLSLRALYSSANVFVLPSRQDNLPNTALESMACGTPIVAFDTCGLSDIVTHSESGYLAKAFDSIDLARGIKWIASSSEEYKIISENSRMLAQEKFEYEKISEMYIDTYSRVLGI